MSTNGQLVFTDVDKITFKGVGNTSNAVVDTVTGKIGVGIDSPDANLHVLGNSYVSTNLELGGTLIMGTVNVEAYHSLEAVTATGNTTPLTVEFQNADTSLVTTGNVEVGKELTVTGNTTVSSNLIVSGNVEVGNELTVTGNATVSSNLIVSGNVEVAKELTVTGNATVSSNLTVNGTLGQNGKEIYAQRRWEIDLTSQSNTIFYPIEFTHQGIPNLPDYYPVHFKVFGESLAGSDSYNENTLVGYARGSGWTDHEPMYDVHIQRYQSGEHRFLGLYEGTSDYAYGIVIYMRGGYKYSALTDANQVITYTSAYTTTGSTFALKDSNGADVSGTSTGIRQLVNISGANGQQHWMSGKLNVSDGDSAYVSSTPHGLVDINQGTRTAGSQIPPSHTPPLYITGGIGSNSGGVEIRHANQSQGIGFGYNTIYATGYASGGNQDLSLKAFGSGTVRLDGGTAITSDDRLKTNEQYLTNATETLLKLKPQVYDKHQKINEICENPVREAGLITQDVYYDAPELRFLVQARNEGLDAIIPVNIPEEKPFVDDDPTKDPDYSGWGTDAAGLNYEGLIPYLIKSNQELHARIQALENAS